MSNAMAAGKATHEEEKGRQEKEKGTKEKAWSRREGKGDAMAVREETHATKANREAAFEVNVTLLTNCQRFPNMRLG